MGTSGEIFYYPNRMGRIVFLAGEEILGQDGINAILNLAGLDKFIDHYPPNNQDLVFPFEHVSNLHSALEAFYGPRGGRGVALRIGRASFQHILREFGPRFGLTDLAFRLLPLKTRLKIGASAFADIFNRYTDQHVQVEENEQILFWQTDRCPSCWGRHSDSPACHLTVGLIQEALYWVSGGKFFNVEESQCIAKGDSRCIIEIDKTPMS